MKIGLLHADGQTDMKTLIAAFRSFANPPKNVIHYKNSRVFPNFNLSPMFITV